MGNRTHHSLFAWHGPQARHVPCYPLQGTAAAPTTPLPPMNERLFFNPPSPTRNRHRHNPPYSNSLNYRTLAIPHGEVKTFQCRPHAGVPGKEVPCHPLRGSKNVARVSAGFRPLRATPLPSPTGNRNRCDAEPPCDHSGTYLPSPTGNRGHCNRAHRAGARGSIYHLPSPAGNRGRCNMTNAVKRE